jgi:hypothetical protein
MYVRFNVIVAVNVEIIVVWNVASCNLVDRYHLFGGTYCLHLQEVKIMLF